MRTTRVLTVEIEDFKLRNLTSRINQLPNKIYSEKLILILIKAIFWNYGLFSNESLFTLDTLVMSFVTFPGPKMIPSCLIMRSAVIILGLSLGFCDLANIPFMNKKIVPTQYRWPHWYPLIFFWIFKYELLDGIIVSTYNWVLIQ